MGWETSLTLAFLGASFIILLIARELKDDENNIRWTHFLPLGIRTLLYFLAFGLLLFPIGIQIPIMVENGIYVNETLMESNDTAFLLRNSVNGGINLVTKSFYTLIIIITILMIVLLIERMTLGGRKDDYARY